MTLRAAIENFTNRLRSAIEAEAIERAKANVLEAFGILPRRGPGRPPKAPAEVRASSKASAALKTRKKPPVQYCPVPYCRDVAAPVFGMVCAKHKDLQKAQIKKYREARKAKKLGAKPAKRSGRAPREHRPDSVGAARG